MSLWMDRGEEPTEAERTLAINSIPAAALAALAESGVIYLPVSLLTQQAALAHTGPLTNYPLFALLFTAAVALSTPFQRSPVMPVVVSIGAIVAGLAQGSIWGHGGPAGDLTMLLIALLVALRIVTLAARDWRNPVNEAFAIGGVALFFELAVAVNVRAGWEPILPVVVLLFFLGSLASRMMSVRLTGWHEGRVEQSSEWLSLPLKLLGVLAVLLVIGWGLGGKGGWIQLAGRALFPVINLVVSVVAFVMSQIFRVVAWLLHALHIQADLASALRKLAARLALTRTRSNVANGPAKVGWFQRVLGLMALVGMIAGVIWAIRRRKATSEVFEPRTKRTEELRFQPKTRARLSEGMGRRLRREMPADTVRRWYAEALVLLEDRRLPKPVSATPGEFLLDVSRHFPESASGFAALTRAYEQVRYGKLVIDRTKLSLLELQRDDAMERIRQAPPVAPEEEQQAV
jgi:flagellar biogenesis protein FliO